MEERNFKGIWIPKEIWLDERLNALEKIILMEIDSLSLNDKGCYASNKYLADFCQCSETKVSNAVTKLIDCGYIDLQSFDGRLRVLQSRLTFFVRQTYKNCEADLQNLQYINNSIDNKTINNNIRENEREKLNSIFINFCTENNVPDKMKNSLSLWIKYKKEIKSKYTETGLRTLLKRALKNYQEYGEDYVVESIEKSMGDNYKGIAYGKNSQPKKVDAFDEILNASIKGE